MRKMNLRTIDLNLLVVLRQLLLERHVSRTAELLSMSQPAVSRALQRLRAMLDDPLLVQTPNGYDLSPRAISIMPQLDQMLKSAELIVSKPVFDPLTSHDVVRFHAQDPLITWFLPPLFKRIRQMAPHMELQARSDPVDGFSLLETGEVHFVLSSFRPASSASSLRALKLAPLEFSIVMGADNPLAKGTLTMESYIAANYGVISLTGKGRGIVEQLLIKRGYLGQGERLNTSLYLSSFTAIPSFCAQSDVLFHLPKQFAQELASKYDLVLHDTFPDLEPRTESWHLYWHERYHKDPMFKWVLQQLKEIHGLAG